MNNVSYICGFHRGGTHAFAEYLAKKEMALYIDETRIRWNYLENVLLIGKGKIKKYDLANKTFEIVKLPVRINDNIIVQCPGLSHKIRDMSKTGKVYWVRRDFNSLIAAMRRANLGVMMWDIMKDFKKEFIDDDIWEKIRYSGKDDRNCNFVAYAALLIKVKEYLYNKYLKKFCIEIETEKQEYFNKDNFKSNIDILRDREKNKINEQLELLKEL